MYKRAATIRALWGNEVMTENAKERARKYVQYLEERCTLPPEVPNNLRPAAFAKHIEGALLDVEKAYRDMQKK